MNLKSYLPHPTRQRIISQLSLFLIVFSTSTKAAQLYPDMDGGTRLYMLPKDKEPLGLRKELPMHQYIPRRSIGSSTPEKLIYHRNQAIAREQEMQQGKQWILFPSHPQKLMPYLDSIFIFGNKCKEAGSLIESGPLSNAAQRVKTAASQIGINYDLTLSFNYASIRPSPAHKKRDFMAFNSSLWGSWTLARDASGNQGIFLMMEVDYGQGMNFNEVKSNVVDSIGSISNPQSSNRGGNGAYIPHLSLGYSGFEGKWIFMLGTFDLTNIFDQNAYSCDWNGDLMNESFNFSSSLPLTYGGFGYVTAWQPCKSFYLMNATTSTNTKLNHNPFSNLSSDEWTNITELGFIFDDSIGLGAGTYRLQYAYTRLKTGNGSTVGINIQQQLGHNSPFGFFSRWGLSDQAAARYTGVQQMLTAGFVLQAPFRNKGWGSSSNNDQIAIGFLWEKAANSEKPYRHSSEYGIELSAVIQITPTFFLQPDIQFIKNPIHAGKHDSECVMQLQGVYRF